MKAKFRLPRSGMALSTALTGIALLSGAPAVFAENSAHPAAGVLKLSNVRVETATTAQLAQAARGASSSSQAGMRAYIDPVTGELRDQTPEEMMEGGDFAPFSKRMSKAATSPRGGTLIELDESHMSNAVVTKDASGKMNMQCVEGHDAAVDSVLGGKAGKAHRHDR